MKYSIKNICLMMAGYAFFALVVFPIVTFVSALAVWIFIQILNGFFLP